MAPKVRKAKKVTKNAAETEITDEIEEEEVKCGNCDKYLWEKIDGDGGGENKNLECEVCMRWFHISCVDVDEQTYEVLQKQNIHWYCDKCEFASKELHKKVAFLTNENISLRNDLNDISVKVQKNEDDIKKVEDNCVAKVSTRLNEENAELKEELKNEVQREMTSMKTELKSQINIEMKAHIEQEILNAANHEGPDDETNPWYKVTKRGGAAPEEAPTPNLRGIINEELAEQRKIDLLKHNLVVSGIAEQEGTEQEIKNKDLRIVQDLIMRELGIDAGILHADRCGTKKDDATRPRPIKIVIRSLPTRKDILWKATTLRQSTDEEIKENVYINPDLTTKQQMDAKNLRTELREMKTRNPGKTLKIKKGQIVEM